MKLAAQKRSTVLGLHSRATLAWALVDQVAPLMDSDRHAWLCAQIGAGETDAAILSALEFYVRCANTLPTRLIGPVASWGAGYRGCDLAERVEYILSRVAPEHTSVAAAYRSGDGRQS